MRKIRRLIFAVIVVVILGILINLAYVKIEYKMYPRGYSALVTKYCSLYAVPDDMIYAVIKCESDYNPSALSNIGAEGLMQITPATFDWAKTKMADSTANDDNLYDPQTNIKYGVFIISLHLAEFGSERVAIAAYHAGRGQVNNWLNNKAYSPDGVKLTTIPFSDTNAYVDRVTSVQAKYDNLYKK